MLTSNRLSKEWREIQKHCPYATIFAKALASNDNSDLATLLATTDDKTDIILFPKQETDLFHWIAFIRGPPDTPFENARFQLKIVVPPTYPHSPPTFTFVTPICHPNIHFKRGEICLDVLKDTWTPTWSLESVCRAIVVLLAAPQPDSPLNCDAGNLLRQNDIRGYWSLARMYTLEYAILLQPSNGASMQEQESQQQQQGKQASTQPSAQASAQSQSPPQTQTSVTSPTVAAAAE